jgi:hypothetical protein
MNHQFQRVRMSTNRLRFRIVMTAISFVAVVVLYYQLSAKLAFVSGCHARVAQLELIASQIATNEADVKAREKALDAAEAQLNDVKQ